MPVSRALLVSALCLLSMATAQAEVRLSREALQQDLDALRAGIASTHPEPGYTVAAERARRCCRRSWSWTTSRRRRARRWRSCCSMRAARARGHARASGALCWPRAGDAC
ncbi:MAG: hypothetical protein HYV16_14140 [Gammaproteobacteria bacterium]|nr:hypothetical protein [Gammaproteobacteria bacterium]